MFPQKNFHTGGQSWLPIASFLKAWGFMFICVFHMLNSHQPPWMFLGALVVKPAHLLAIFALLESSNMTIYCYSAFTALFQSYSLPSESRKRKYSYDSMDWEGLQYQAVLCRGRQFPKWGEAWGTVTYWWGNCTHDTIHYLNHYSEKPKKEAHYSVLRLLQEQLAKKAPVPHWLPTSTHFTPASLGLSVPFAFLFS